MALLNNRLQKWAEQELLAEQPLHLDIFRAAILMLEMGYAEDLVFSFLRNAADAVPDRPVPDLEIRGAIDYAKARLTGGVTGVTWPKFEPAYRNEVVARYSVSLEDLAARSEKLNQNAWFYLFRLYAEDDFVCLGRTAYDFGTQKLPAWQEPMRHHEYEYVSPNPMKFEWGFTKSGEPSMHCLDNCGPKVFQVVEFDFGGMHEHAALLRWLGKKMPLVLVVYSGGKSLHGWFNVKGRSEEQVLAFFQDAVSLGADPKMWSPVQFSRLPGGTNSKTKRHQSVVVFQPSNLKP